MLEARGKLFFCLEEHCFVDSLLFLWNRIQFILVNGLNVLSWKDNWLTNVPINHLSLTYIDLVV